MMTITEQNLLEKCKEIELLCKDLYTLFAELFAGNDDIAQLWQKTANEEQNHAEQFTMAIRLKKGLSCQVIADSKRVESMLLNMRTLIEKVKLHPPKLLEALSSAIKLENHLSEFHLGCVVIFEDTNCKNLFTAMMNSDQEHISSLQAAYENLACIKE
jgi:rubrerythrin